MRTLEAWVMRSLPQDKCLHVIAGVLIFAVAHFTSWQIGIAAVLFVGIAKEVLDHFTGGDVSAWDVLATATGGVLALLCFAR